MKYLADTIAKMIYDNLKSEGFDVYFPGQHVGVCKSRYVVVKPGMDIPYVDYSTNIIYYDLLLYVPQRNFSSYAGFLNDVEKAMTKIFPTLRCTNNRSQPYFDDSVKGWMVSTEYVNYRKVYSDYINQQTDSEEE